MANTFTTLPSNLQGDVTIGGNLTVLGGLVKIADGPYLMRVGNLSGLLGDGWTVNYDPVAGRDDPSQAGFASGFSPTAGQRQGLIDTDAETLYPWSAGAVMFSRTDFVSHTGAGSHGTVYPIPLRSHALINGKGGHIVTKVRGNAAVAGGGGIVVNAVIGANTLQLLSVPAGVTEDFEIDVSLTYDTGPIKARLFAKASYSGGAPQIGHLDFVFDPTLLSELDITWANTAAGDVVTFYSGTAQQLCTQ